MECGGFFPRRPTPGARPVVALSVAYEYKLGGANAEVTLAVLDYDCFKKLFTRGLANQRTAAMPADTPAVANGSAHWGGKCDG